GFTVVFVTFGALAGTVGALLSEYQTAVNMVSGLVVIFFGLNYLGVIRLNLFRGIRHSVNTDDMGFLSALFFGMVFSVGWTPCVGTFLGSALMLASRQAHAVEGMLMLLAYSLGLGIPFVLSAVLIDCLKSAFTWIKKNYKIINTISGILLVLLGLLMATGTYGRLFGLFS
ncbi:MAG: cytochrome c biogenesis protein CcdA, partial [Lachnospiraceae bacterium]|nr:cytochrome c biogenesis protein CcdA [Lachnospiraceae bacterium]